MNESQKVEITYSLNSVDSDTLRGIPSEFKEALRRYRKGRLSWCNIFYAGFFGDVAIFGIQDADGAGVVEIKKYGEMIRAEGHGPSLFVAAQMNPKQFRDDFAEHAKTRNDVYMPLP